MRSAGSNIGEEVGFLHELHREKPLSVDEDKLVQTSQVRVHDFAERAKLTRQSVEPLGIDVLERLERHDIIALRVIDNPHPTPV
jgi:hypothetical protein